MSSRPNRCGSRRRAGQALIGRPVLATAASLCLLMAAGGGALAGDFLDALGFEGRVVDAAHLPPESAPAAASAPGDALPDGRPAFGNMDIREAWLIAPTARYGHGVLGDATEAGGLFVRGSDGGTYRYMLPEDAVFEDLQPRLADLDGDGLSEVIVVKSYLASGAALALYGLRDGALQPLDETPPVGHANRWLNPAGTADFDGDGHEDVAYVETPHIGGTLHVYRFVGQRLEPVASRAGFSNHAIGSRALDLSHAGDLDADGRAELILPGMGRRTLAVVSLDEGELRVRDRIRLPARVVGDFRWAGGETGSDLYVPLADGSAYRLSR
ncbi:MAG: VCBS repeat-containing protein [Rhodovibrionaceae bacterium]|nr:VCBS repeat-containing protein [Rhodovibrionaceae bacterium]